MYTFFEQCPHRMACARCDFYAPKHSSRARLLEAKDNLRRMRATIPLTDEEQAAIDDTRPRWTGCWTKPTMCGKTYRRALARAVCAHRTIDALGSRR